MAVLLLRRQRPALSALLLLSVACGGAGIVLVAPGSALHALQPGLLRRFLCKEGRGAWRAWLRAAVRAALPLGWLAGVRRGAA